jgi:hypothetical protein
MPAIYFDKRKVSPLNIDFSDVRFHMDTEPARTLLIVITSGSFISAADRLHVSQSTVSTRIHSSKASWLHTLCPYKLAQRSRLPVDNFKGTATRVGKWWIRLFPEAGRAASP